jgi:hypothetical protein
VRSWFFLSLSKSSHCFRNDEGADRIAAMGALFITYQLDRSAAKWRYLLFYPRLNLCH